MKNKLTIWEWLNKLIGKRFVANHHTNEIHDLSRHHVNCHTNMIVSKKFIGKKKQELLMTEGYNGCRYCMPEKNTG